MQKEKELIWSTTPVAQPRLLLASTEEMVEGLPKEKKSGGIGLGSCITFGLHSHKIQPSFSITLAALCVHTETTVKDAK